MIKLPFVLPNNQPLTRGTAAGLVHLAQGFVSSLTVEQADKVVNLKSMLGLLSLGASLDLPMTVVADGEDEENAIQAIQALMAGA